jgi:hypothetical protein
VAPISVVSIFSEVVNMGLLKSLFGSKPAERFQFKVEENRLSIDQNHYQVRVRKEGMEIYAEELFQSATKPKDLRFGRFYLLRENPPKPHFAPSLEEAIDWFIGRGSPKDGYQTVAWGDKASHQCAFCQCTLVEPLRITKIERLTVSTRIPTDLEIVGWRVVEVATDQMGPGIPTKFMDLHRTRPVIKWLSGKKKYVCEDCTNSIWIAGRAEELEDCANF